MIDGWWVVAAAILAVGIGPVAWLVRRAGVRKRSGQIEAYLRSRKQDGREDGRCSITQLMEQLRMTKRQVLEACRHNPAIMRLATTAEFPGAIFADAPIFEYAPLRGRF